jgi:uncharacterized membrane protein
MIIREVANTTIAPVLIPRFPTIINNTFGGNVSVNVTRPNWTSAIINTVLVYPDAMGLVAYVILWLIPFAMMFISQGNARMAAVVGCLTIALAGFFIGGTYYIIGSALILLTLVGVVVGLFRPS